MRRLPSERHERAIFLLKMCNLIVLNIRPTQDEMQSTRLWSNEFNEGLKLCCRMQSSENTAVMCWFNLLPVLVLDAVPR